MFFYFPYAISMSLVRFLASFIPQPSRIYPVQNCVMGSGRLSSCGGLHWALGLCAAFYCGTSVKAYPSQFSANHQCHWVFAGDETGFIDRNGAVVISQNRDGVILYTVCVFEIVTSQRKGGAYRFRHPKQPLDQIHTVRAEVDHRSATALFFMIEMSGQPIARAAVVDVAETAKIYPAQFAAVNDFLDGSNARATLMEEWNIVYKDSAARLCRLSFLRFFTVFDFFISFLTKNQIYTYKRGGMKNGKNINHYRHSDFYWQRRRQHQRGSGGRLEFCTACRRSGRNL